MSNLELTVYDALAMPINVCDIILSYKTRAIQISNIYNDIYYECDNVLTKCTCRDVTIGIIDNIIYYFRTHQYNRFLYVYCNNECIKVLEMYNDIYTIKYSNGLLCEYAGAIIIYDVIIDRGVQLIERNRLEYKSDFVTLLYADANYIIKNNDYIEHNNLPLGLTIYDSNFKLIHHITSNEPIQSVAMVNNVLSYYICKYDIRDDILRRPVEAWIPIEF